MPVLRQRYEFRVSGRLTEHVRAAVVNCGEVRVSPAPPEMIIHGPVADQSYLPEFLTFLENLGLRIVSVHRLPDEAGSAPRRTGTGGTRPR